jgi:membrane protein
MANQVSKWRKLRDEALALWNETNIGSQASLSKMHQFAHFWVLVWKSFTRNRCPARASALAYASLLALIPMLAVVVSVTSSVLKKEGEQRIDDFIVKFVSSVTPPSMLSSTNMPLEPAATNDAARAAPEESTNATAVGSPVDTNAASAANSDSSTNSASVSTLAEDQRVLKARKEIARSINQFIQNTRSGTLGVTGGVLLIFAAISMLSRIEDTLNDIWGVHRGRNWFTRLVLYWGLITLVPILLVGALGLATGRHWQSTRDLLFSAPWLAAVLFRLLPIVVICFTFALFYMLMPNTKVHWQAALVGGVVGGLLVHFNNLVSVLYVSRVVSNSKIYGSLGLVPVFMIGLYFAWWILLFGAQVSYAFQNRTTYLEEKQAENVNQRGREFVALRLMTCVGQHFLQGLPPPSVVEVCQSLKIPSRLIQQTMHTLSAARLIVETGGPEPAYLPARPLEQITCHDVLVAMRAVQGQELATKEEPARTEVYGEFNRIREAEKKAASCVTIAALAQRALACQITEQTNGDEQPA